MKFQDYIYFGCLKGKRFSFIDYVYQVACALQIGIVFNHNYNLKTNTRVANDFHEYREPVARTRKCNNMKKLI